MENDGGRGTTWLCVYPVSSRVTAVQLDPIDGGGWRRKTDVNPRYPVQHVC